MRGRTGVASLKFEQEKISTGVEGLDDVLLGGLPRNRLYLIEGSPGAGKTTLALQFLLEGVRRGEKVLYVTLSESEDELQAVANSHGWTLQGIDLFELKEINDRLQPEQDYTVFRPEDVELIETVDQVYRRVEEAQPVRTVFDSLSEMRLLAGDALRYRRQILRLKNFFAGRRSTVLLLDDKTAPGDDRQLHSISHGVISLDRRSEEYGNSRRRLNVTKIRGSRFRDGFHDYAIETGGLRVFPRLVASEHRKDHHHALVSTGLPLFDAMLGGGLAQGASTVLIGPAGSGKSTMAAMCLKAASVRGDRSSCYLFEENRSILMSRMAAINLDLAEPAQKGLLTLRQMDPADMSPGAFAAHVRRDVEQKGVRMVMIDSVNGYLNGMPSERFLLLHMHELLSYLAEKGVITLLVMAQSGTIGAAKNPVDLSYLSDTLILFRYFEMQGSVRKAVSVLKARASAQEAELRELRMSPRGVELSEPLREFRGVLTGVPVYTGPAVAVPGNDHEDAA